MQFPITVASIAFGQEPLIQPKGVMHNTKAGDMVAVRPCREEFGNKTFLGIYLGDMAISTLVKHDPETNVLTVSRAMYNPAMFVPDIGEVIYGCGSYWRKIASEKELTSITDADINSVWYVKALKQIATNSQDTPNADNQEG